MIQLANAHKILVDLFVKHFGGAINERKSYIGKDGSVRKISHQWKLEKAPKCLPFLENIIPYLIIKKERAGFLKNYILDNSFIRGSNQLSDEILHKREAAYIKMRSMNDIPLTHGSVLNRSLRRDVDDNLFWAYVAGLMDTDGSFSLKKENRTSGGSKSPVYTPTILLTMIDCRAIYYLVNNFVGGNLCEIKAKTAKQGFCYRFSITSRKNAIKFLKKCIPFLYAKKDIAEALLLFCETTKLMNGINGVSTDQLVFREQNYSKIKALNTVVKSSIMDLADNNNV